ncbi:MAG: LD-carboxypeptidase, partial [Candidatus Falkowbacteria bacterium]|nr:LD-carboxypeptidase [Candidatus Falkowbacteria bacterium]
MKLIKPNKIIIGDTIAIVSPSWGGPASFPHIYESGIKILENLGFKIKEYPTARMDADQLYNRPQLRAMDINDAFADTEVKAIFTSIGGEDSVRILPFLDVEVIKKNPKILLGYSDTTTLTAYLNQLGLITFNGPSIMSGFSQWESLGKQFQQHILTFLFGEITNVNYPTYENYSEGYPNWDDKNNIGKINELKENIGWHWLQGSTITTGKLFGGCIEVLQ